MAVESWRYLWRSGIGDEPGRSSGVQTCRDEGRVLQAQGVTEETLAMLPKYKATREDDVSLLRVPETIAGAFELKKKLTTQVISSPDLPWEPTPHPSSSRRIG